MTDLSHKELYELVRDGTSLKGASRTLLETVAWRSNPRQNYICYASYSELAEDTHYSEQILSIAVRELEAAGYIRRIIRPHQHNVYFLNVPLLLKMAEQKRATTPARVEIGDENPFGIEQSAETLETDTSTEDDTAPPDDDEEGELPACRNVDDAIGMVRTIWPNHPMYNTPRGMEFLRKDLEACIKHAGGSYRCGDVLYNVARDLAVRETVGRSRSLGSYLKKVFPAWVERYADELLPLGETPELRGE
jgi:hypothetical protein